MYWGVTSSILLAARPCGKTRLAQSLQCKSFHFVHYYNKHQKRLSGFTPDRRFVLKISIQNRFFHRLLTKQRIELVARDLFFDDQKLCCFLQNITVIHDDLLGIRIALVDDLLDFLIDLGSLTPQNPAEPSGLYFLRQINLFLYGNTVIAMV